VVVSVIEITMIVVLVTVVRAKPLMARMIRHDAMVRKWWGRTRVAVWQGHGKVFVSNGLPDVFRMKRFSSGSFVSYGISAISSQSASGIGVVR
jgi:hypothetical protein